MDQPAPSPQLLNLPVKRDKSITSMLSPAVGAFVTELASGLEPMLAVMQRYGISKQQMRGLLSNEVFRAALVEAKAAYTASSNAADRIKVKAQLAVEELMADMVSIAGHPAHPPSARVMAYNAIKSLTGLEKPEPQPQKQRFNLTINLPSPSLADPNHVTPTQITIEAEHDIYPQEPVYDDPVDPDGTGGSDDGVLRDEPSEEYPSISLAGTTPTHDTFRRGAKGYIPRNEQPGQPINIITNRPL